MEGTEGPAQYRAFISYSHRDAAFGRRLHRRLEGYRLPRRLAGRAGARGPAPRRLVPIFRDREELPAAHDLTAQVRAALAASDSLVVVCSPNARGSPWVAREVEVFRTLHPDRPVLAALIEGEPGEAFPEPLRSGEVEPLAADFRRGRDGARLGLLKLVAGIAGVGLDQLVQRDAQRRLRGVTAVTAGALVLALGMGGLAAFALQQRAEAERQRAEAEGLIEFMLTDLRTRLKGVGRLDVLTAVNQRVLERYEKQDLRRLPAEELERSARGLHNAAEDEQTLGNLPLATRHLGEARRRTAALLAKEPDHPERIWAHGQSVFWTGAMALERDGAAQARQDFLEYRRLSEQLVRRDPSSRKYLREAGYAEGNLCTLALQPPKNPPEALRSCAAALQRMEQAAAAGAPDPTLEADLVNRHAWMADAYVATGDLAKARAHRLKQEALLARMIAADPRNMERRFESVTLQRALGRLAWRESKLAEAALRLGRASEAIDALVAFDPSNEEWRSVQRKIRADREALEAGREIK